MSVKLVVKKKSMCIEVKNILIAIFLISSCLNSLLLAIWTITVPLILVFLYKQQGAIEALILIQLRSLLNPGIAIEYMDTVSIIKWIILFALSIYLLLDKGWKNPQLKNISIIMSLFSIVIILSGWVNSSYPVVATFKVLSYIIPFLAIIKGVAKTSEIDWLKRILALFGFFLFGSIFLMGSSVGYLRNGYAFQGFFNHPNIYGVLLSVFVAGYLYSQKKSFLLKWLVVLFSIILVLQSGSRTALFSIIAVLFIYLLTSEMNNLFRIAVILFTVGMITLIFISENAIYNSLSEIFLKGQETDLLFSRRGQIDGNLTRFLGNSIFGTGFNVPYIEGVRSMTFSFNLVVENGNLILALLGDLGIVGFLLFVFSYWKIFRIGKLQMTTIFFVPFIVSMGEMSFFSTNNFGIILYFFFAIYMSSGNNDVIDLEKK